MKNSSQADGKSSRVAQSEQARKTAGDSQKETQTSGAAASPRGLGSQLFEQVFIPLESEAQQVEALLYFAFADMERQQLLEDKGIRGVMPSADAVRGFLQLKYAVRSRLEAIAASARAIARELGRH